MDSSTINIQQDLEAVSRIPVVSTILEVVCRTTGMGFAAIARVTDKQWVACAVRDEIAFGLKPGGELELETTICHEIRQTSIAVVIDHVSEHPVFAQHHTPAQYGFQSYISYPIFLKGTFFGTLCAIDPRPNQLDNPQIRGMFQLFAELISFHLQSILELDQAEVKLAEERQTATQREQFIAVLGHDLTNSVSAITSSAQILKQMPLEKHAINFADIIQQSGRRMAGLIDNVLDFARGRMGEGIAIDRKLHEMTPVLHHVVSEMRMIWPGRIIDTRFNLEALVFCDEGRMAQLFSNLLGNALKYSPADTSVLVEAQSSRDGFTLSVTNAGEKIPEATLAGLFRPFSRGTLQQDQKSLGLGLYIAFGIATAHGGQLSAGSDDQLTRFTFHCPADPPSS